MKDLSYYQLRAHLFHREADLRVHFKLHELEPIWFCTIKNIKRKLKRFSELGLIEYFPGKGRGNSSQIHFYRSFQSEVEELVTNLVQRDQLDDLFQLMQYPIPKSWFSNARLEIEKLFGHHIHTDNRDSLRVIITRDITTLDPVYTSVSFESSLLKHLGDTLTVYDSSVDEVRPHLAHHWELGEDEKTWTFYLRKGVMFHHQRIMTSQDVKYSFERFNQPTQPYYWLVQDIQEIYCPTRYVIQFRLKKPNSFFLRYISIPNLSILPGDVPFDEYQWIGTGPFKLKERTGKKFVLEAFDYYFSERPFIDEIEFWRVPREDFQVETFHIVQSEDHSELNALKRNETGFRFLAFNFNKQNAIQQHAFRQAIYHLLDMQEMWNDLGRVDLVEATSFFLEKSVPKKKLSYLIKANLDESGYQGEPLNLYIPDSPIVREECTWLQNKARLYGLQLNLKEFKMGDLYSSKLQEDADLLSLGEVASEDTHLSFIGAFLSESLIFRRFFPKKQLRTIEMYLEEMKREKTIHAREKWIDRVEEIIRDEHLLIFTHHPFRNRMFHPMIKDVHYQLYGHVDLRKLWIQ